MIRKRLKGESKMINLFPNNFFSGQGPQPQFYPPPRLFVEVKKQPHGIFLELGGDSSDFSLRTLISSCLCDSWRWLLVNGESS